MNLNNLTIYDMAFSTRVVEVFKINNVTMEDILKHKYTLNDFLRMPNIGKKSVKEIKETFLSHGFHFKDNDKFFKELDHHVDAINAHKEKQKEEPLSIRRELNLQIIDKCREVLKSSFNGFVNKDEFTYEEFNKSMEEHKKILRMFEDNVINLWR